MATDEWTQLYWQQQYESVRHHEAQRLTVSNITMSLTLVVLALAFNEGDFNVANGLALPLAVVAANASAIFFHLASFDQIEIHRKRANRVLGDNTPALFEVSDVAWSSPGRFNLGRRRSLLVVHIALCLLAVVPLGAWIA